MLTYKVESNNLETANKMEFIRLSSYGFTPTEEEYDSYYIQDIINGRLLVITCYQDNKLVGGCYISATFNSLYIDYLFILPEYQETGLRLGRKLLQFILDNKHIVEEYFDTEFNQSKLYAPNEKTKNIYKKMGYKQENDLLCKKLLG